MILEHVHVHELVLGLFLLRGFSWPGLLVYFLALLIMIYDEWDNEDLLEISHKARMRKRVA